MADFLFSEGPIRALREAATPFLDALFTLITNTGSVLFFLVVLLLVYWLWDTRLGFLLSLVLLVSAGLNGYLKALFGMPRPSPRWHTPVVLTSNGFPSGHAQTTTAFWTTVGLRLPGGWIPVAAVMAALVAFSRVYLGLHFVGDVLGGAAIGLGLGLAAYALSRASLWDGLGLRVRLGLAMVLPAVWGGILLPLGPDAYLFWGLLTGLSVGYLLERERVGLERARGVGSAAIRVLVGFPAVGGLFAYGGALTQPLLIFPLFLLLGLLVALILPWVFMRLEAALLQGR